MEFIMNINKEVIAKTILEYMFDFGAVTPNLSSDEFEIENVQIEVRNLEGTGDLWKTIKFQSFTEMLDFVWDDRYCGCRNKGNIVVGQFVYKMPDGSYKNIPCVNFETGEHMIATAEYIQNMCNTLQNFVVALQSNMEQSK